MFYNLYNEEKKVFFNKAVQDTLYQFANIIVPCKSKASIATLTWENVTYGIYFFFTIVNHKTLWLPQWIPRPQNQQNFLDC